MRAAAGRSELLQSDDLDWDGIADSPVDPGVLDCLVYMRDVEGFTTRDLTGLAAHPTTLGRPAHRPVPSDLAGRGSGARRRARAVHRRLRRRPGLTLPARQSPPPSTPPFRERVAVLATRPVGHVIAATHMAWGATNELLTLNGYRILAERCGHPTLRELLRRIAAQESRHYSFYVLQVEWRLAASRLARGVVASSHAEDLDAGRRRRRLQGAGRVRPRPDSAVAGRRGRANRGPHGSDDQRASRPRRHQSVPTGHRCVPRPHVCQAWQPE